MANALRVGDQLRERLDAPPAASSEITGTFNGSDAQTMRPHATGLPPSTR
jgi:hypothetical protein